MRISDWSSDVCSSDLVVVGQNRDLAFLPLYGAVRALEVEALPDLPTDPVERVVDLVDVGFRDDVERRHDCPRCCPASIADASAVSSLAESGWPSGRPGCKHGPAYAPGPMRSAAAAPSILTAEEGIRSAMTDLPRSPDRERKRKSPHP